jgi:hypothetical protein
MNKREFWVSAHIGAITCLNTFYELHHYARASHFRGRRGGQKLTPSAVQALGLIEAAIIELDDLINGKLDLDAAFKAKDYWLDRLKDLEWCK